MKNLLSLIGNLLGVLALIAVAIGLIVMLRSVSSASPTQSPLATPASVAQSPLATPMPQPTSPFPTMTPWTPPTASPKTPTPLPPSPVAKNPAGKLLWHAQQSGFYEAGVDSKASVIVPESRTSFQPPANVAQNYDFYSQFKQFVPSPNRHYIIALGENAGGQYAFVIDTQTRKSALSKFDDYGLYWLNKEGRPQSIEGTFFGWHPNGYEVLFWEDNAPDLGLWRIDVRTSEHQLLAQPSTLNISGAAISPDGQQLAYATNSFDVHQVWMANSDGSEPRLLIESNTVVYVFSWSSDGRYLLYAGEPTPAVNKGTPVPNIGGPLWVMDRNGKNRKALHAPFIFGFGFVPIWSPSGHSVASVGGTDEAAPCWRKGDAFQADPLCWFKGTGVYVEDIDTGDLQLVARSAIDPVWSPDSSWLAVSQIDTKQQVDIWLVDILGRTPRRLTDTPEVDRYPIWLQP
jgi:WD40 repeat protein